MQFSERWLRTMADPDMGTEELARLLTMSGLEVEETSCVAPPFSGVVAAKVLEVKKHPNADRLTVCQVDAGTGALLNIVCGAPNVRAGMMTACALPGASLPPGENGKAFSIKPGKLRGVESQGMLCSARELGISDDHAGIMDLPGDAPVGQDVRAYLDLDDVVYTIKLTPNRADCLSVLGVAREVSALTGAPLCMPDAAPVAATMEEKLPLAVLAPDLCGRFSGRVIRGVNARAETPDWMKQRLIRSGQRPVSALVDISNYVMLELGQPNHVYDLDKLDQGLEVRWGRKGEQVSLLNGSTLEADGQVGVIADGKGAESLAGIMGGDRSSVSLETEHIFIEAAFWQPEAIQGRCRRFNFSTDAAHRFERGVDFEGTVRAIERMTALVLEVCGVPGKTQVGPTDDHVFALPPRQPVRMRTARAERVVGVPFTDKEVADIFTRLGLSFSHEPGVFVVTPPGYRFDIAIEEDLIEEVARVYGYDRIPAVPPVAPNVMRVLPESCRSVHDIRRQMADMDYQETVNYSFVEEGWEKDFAGNSDPIRLLNPISSQMSVMRSTLLGSLVANVRYNLNRRATRVRMFEIASVFLKDPTQADGEKTVAGYCQPKRLAAVAYGTAENEQWGQPSRQVDFFDVKADLEALFFPQVFRFEKAEHPAFHPGRCARILREGTAVGIIGELHPLWQKKYELPLPPVLFELDVEALQPEGVPVYQDISRFPPVLRDVALVVPQSVSVASLMDIFEMARRKNPQCAIMQSVVLFDDYRGKGIEENERSLAFRFTLQDDRATLQDEAVEAAIAAFVAAAKDAAGARLRA
ncbi:MAG: phenylalanine--tRNA ligase subunit beta [Oxalobacter formigenes]|nr:phenylalanine--tRNA ligase subunit beta [Oxalobacter formigenes]